jgi:hypothetical protein
MNHGDHLEWGLHWPWPIWLLVGALGVAVLALAAWNVRKLPSKRRRALLLVLRLLTVASVLAILGQPTWVSRSLRAGGQRIAVVLDRSASMARGPEGKTRWNQALAAAARLERKQPVAWYTLAQRLEPARSLAEVKARKPDGQATDLLAGLADLGDARRSAGLAAVVVVSDGLDNGPLHARTAGDAKTLDAESAETLDRLRLAIHALAIGDAKPARDIAVTALRASAFGFTRTFMPVTIELELTGYDDADGELALTLKDNGRVAVEKKLPLRGPAQRTVELEFQPLHVGPHLLEASVAPLPDEATVVNNRAWASLQVVRDRTRVLHLAGHPSWDTRFLRGHLRGNPAVDLVSFYIMIGQGAAGYVSGEDTTLIPFPTREIFEDSLSSFDLVIFQDFPFGPFQVERYLPELHKYVTGGGAFLVLGGRQSLSGGGYYGTALAEWLPVKLEPLLGADVGWQDGAVTPMLTPAGALHPVSLLAADADGNNKAWNRHAFSGRNTSLRAGGEGNVLATDTAGHPLLAVADIGDGRSAVLATDSLWQWAFPPLSATDARDVSRDDYHRLLDQLTAWLLRDPDLNALRLEPPTDPVTAGQPVRVRVTARSAGGQPVSGLTLRWRLLPLAPPPDKTKPVKVAAEKDADAPAPESKAWQEPTDERGEAVLALEDVPPGPHQIQVEAVVDGRNQQAIAPFAVAPATREASRLQPSDHLLGLLAKSSGGQLWHDDAPAAGVPVAQQAEADLSDLDHTDLWTRPEVMVWLALLLGCEWFLRRRWGLA